MSFQFRINRLDEFQAIDILFGKQFLLPIVLLAVVIIGMSVLLSDNRAPIASYAEGNTINSAEITRLQQQLAGLEGESQRLKAFAKKMVELAKLDKDIFDFDKPPARGGLGGRNIFQRYTSDVTTLVDKDLQTLKRQLIDRSNQLERMQLVLKSRILGASEKRSKWPVSTGYLSSSFGLRKDPFNGRLRRHNGIDLAGPRGSAIMSVAKGKVLFSGRKGGYGRVVDIKHANGYVSRYAHLEASLVKKGQLVAAGEKIARLGTSGRSTGPHLHLEILKNNKHIDPMIFLGKRK